MLAREWEWERVFDTLATLYDMGAIQASLLDLLPAPARISALSPAGGRIELGRGAWVDLRQGWLPDHARLFDVLDEIVPWKAERRPMYDRIVDVPRLVAFYEDDAALPDPALELARSVLNAQYGPELGEPLATAGLCLYRDGRDSVAWHGDTIGRGATEDTVVAIVSLGTPRRMLLRARGGGAAMRFEIGLGDLFVMGGSCQRTFEHAIPKTARPVGARISVQFRPSGVR